MKRFRSVQTRPNTSILWPYEGAPLSSPMSAHPDIISVTRTLSEDQLTLVTDFIFPDSFDYDTFKTDPTRQTELSDGSQYMLENGITYSYSIDDI